MKIIINENNSGLKYLKKVYYDEGLLSLKKLTRINSYELIKILDLTIDPFDFPMLFKELLDDGLIPNEYNGFIIDSDYFSGTIDWDIKTNDYSISFLATAFWDGEFVIPIDVNYYTDNNLGITINDYSTVNNLFERVGFNPNIPIDDKMTYFVNYDSLLKFINDFYYPKVYKKLKEIITILQGNIDETYN
jgi:hypothetical protein